MNLPINLDDLFSARTVEWERLEFKEGWNPEAVLRTMCAFANDFHNLGGGYIVLGVAERDGRPVLPPSGLSINDIDRIQQDIVSLGYRIQPQYHPIMFPTVYQKKNVLILWAVAGQTRPYKAPASLSRKNTGYRYYIRKGSVTLVARDRDERELLEMAASVPFDDRGNPCAGLETLDLGLIRSYLQQVRSSLFEEAAKMDFLQLCRGMNLIDGPDEHVRSKNVWLMFFNSDPQKYFPQSQIDIVHFPDGPGADTFTEKIFRGPVHMMLSDALNHIKSQFIEEKVQKFQDGSKSERRYNYPYVAIREALTNAVYHRSYEIREPVEVRISPDRISILSFPGPDRSIRDSNLRNYNFVARRYRNRRVGEFLKELEMTEGRNTGIPRILRAIEENDSPKPHFETDPDRTWFISEFPIHPAFTQEKGLEDARLRSKPGVESRVESGVESDMQTNILLFLREAALGKKKLAFKLGKPKPTRYLNDLVKKMLEEDLIEYTIPKKPKSRFQKYRLTAKGRALIKGLQS